MITEFHGIDRHETEAVVATLAMLGAGRAA
jgi:hypothetical protein